MLATVSGNQPKNQEQQTLQVIITLLIHHLTFSMYECDHDDGDDFDDFDDFDYFDHFDYFDYFDKQARATKKKESPASQR